MIPYKKKNEKNVFQGKRKALKYLKKYKQNQTNQTRLLNMYVNGELEEILKEYNFDLIEVFVDGNLKIGLDLQVNLRKKDKNFGVDFFNTYYETCFYISGYSPKDIESSIFRNEYQNFNLENFLRELEKKL
jgi:hypothetical protein